MIAPTAVNNNPELIQKANEFVNQVFWGTLLRDVRGAQKPTVLDDGPGRMTFVKQLDMELIKCMSSQRQTPLARALIRQLEPNRINNLHRLHPKPIERVYRNGKGVGLD